MNGRRIRKHFIPMQIFTVIFVAAILYLGGRLVYEEVQGKQIHQEIVELGEISYDEAFLTEIQKLDGFLSVSPVYEIPVKLRWGDFSVDTMFTAVDFDTFRSTGTAATEIEAGNTPVLLLGEETLTGFMDLYGRPISKKGIEKFWASAAVPELEFCFSADALSGQASSGSGNSASGASSFSQTDSLLWRPCLAAARLTNPSEGIYIPLFQLSSLTQTLPPVKKILLTTKGVKSIL